MCGGLHRLASDPFPQLSFWINTRGKHLSELDDKEDGEANDAHTEEDDDVDREDLDRYVGEADKTDTVMSDPAEGDDDNNTVVVVMGLPTPIIAADS